MDPAGEVDLGFRRLIGHVVSKVSGCLYCQAHTLLGAHNFGVSDAMLDDIKKTLWATADKLRANMDAAEYKHLVLGLIFLKYISDTFAARRAELAARLPTPTTSTTTAKPAPKTWPPSWKTATTTKRPTSSGCPKAPAGSSCARRQAADIGKRIDDALTLIEGENPKLKGILDKRYARAQLPDGKLGELVDLVSTIGFGDDPSVARDVLGQVYEYFLGMFASAEGKRAGSSTPRPASSRPWWPCSPPPRQGVRPLLRLGRHVCAERKVHRSPRRQAGRRVHLRAREPTPPPGAWPP
jgi:hypothetical protein